MSTENKKVMVIGGGIAGLTVAWELSRFNISVELIEKTCFLGGHAIQFCCKATDECLQCGACSVEDMLKKVADEPNINVHLATEVESINKDKKFAVSLKKSSLLTDSEKLNESGICYEESSLKGAVLRGYSKNNTPLYVILDKKICDDNPGAVPEGAVELDKMGMSGTIEVDAVVLASGFKPFNAEIKETYGYRKFNNVITGLDMERIKREKGAIVRPSDGKEPQKVAFIQCVGSRDERLGNLWCSHVCCPYALRMAENIKYKNNESEVTVFYMDIQNAGKNFPEFYEKCKLNQRFIRNIPVDIYPMEGDQLRLRYMAEDDGLPVEEVFDLVVLSIGIMPNLENSSLAEIFGIELTDDGFFAGKDNLNRTSTSKSGIFIAGTAEGPKTIAASMAHAGQAAGEVMKHLGVS